MKPAGRRSLRVWRIDAAALGEEGFCACLRALPPAWHAAHPRPTASSAAAACLALFALGEDAPPGAWRGGGVFSRLYKTAGAPAPGGLSVRTLALDALPALLPAVRERGPALGWPRGDRGQPFPDGWDSPAGRRYVSLTHSGGLAAALASPAPVGLDEQRLPGWPPGRVRRLLGRLHPAERAALAALSDKELIPAFTALWARKESVLKLTGRGLALPLSSFCCAAGADCEAAGRRVRLLSVSLDESRLAAAEWV